MEIVIEEREANAAVAHLKGRLDLKVAQDVKARLEGVVAGRRPRIVLDLGGVSFVDSSGLGALVGVLKAARLAGGDVRIAAPGEQVRYVLKLSSLDRVLVPHTTVEDAFAGLR